MDDDLPPGFAALCQPPKVTVRFEWHRPPFRAYWRWNGIECSVSRWTPRAARDRAHDLFAPRIDRAVEQWFEDDRARRQREQRRRELIAVFGEQKGAEVFDRMYGSTP